MGLVKPPGDYRVWIDGSYKDGFIGYGIVILPGHREIHGGERVKVPLKPNDWRQSGR